MTGDTHGFHQFGSCNAQPYCKVGYEEYALRPPIVRAVPILHPVSQFDVTLAA